MPAVPAATLTLDTNFNTGPIDRRIFSGFLEHLGRSVYEGAYDPGNPLSDGDGFRTDVLDALRTMDMPAVRYPGGNFVSSYDWRDGVGPRHARPVRPDFAWKSIEPNTFGTDEFMKWCRKLGTEPMMAVNLGTAGAREAGELVEYCNLPTGTSLADLRASNGAVKPYGVKLWCLGNEMDGPWQAGQVPAEEYARRADQAAKLMRGLDPSIEVVAAGSSGKFMPTYMHWDRTVLEYCWDQVQYISAHRYSGNNGDSAEYLAEGVIMDRILADYDALLGYVRAVKKSVKRVHLSFDEWNVWYRDRGQDGGWKIAPHLLEEQYNFEDAVVCAQFLASFIRRADLVKIACIAQLVNVIGPVMTRPDGVLIQPIMHPFRLMSRHMRGVSLTPRLEAPTYKAGGHGPVPALDAAAALDGDRLALTLVNRRPRREQTLRVRVDDRRITGVVTADVLHNSSLKATNTWDAPDRVRLGKARASVQGSELVVKLPGPSVAVVTVRVAAR